MHRMHVCRSLARAMAQLVARMHGVHEAVGSNPTSPTMENSLSSEFFVFGSLWADADAEEAAPGPWSGVIRRSSVKGNANVLTKPHFYGMMGYRPAAEALQ